MGLKRWLEKVISNKKSFVIFMLVMIVVCSAIADLLTFLTRLAIGGGAQ